MFVIIAGVVVIILVLVFVIVRSGAGASDSLEDRLNEMAAMGQSVTLEDLELSRPFTERVLMPIWEGVAGVAQRFTPQSTLEQAEREIALAGMTQTLTPAKFYAIRMGAMVLAAAIGFIGMGLAGSFGFLERIGGGLGGMAFGYSMPSMWLGSKRKSRQDEVLKALPDALDLLTICVEAGLGFDAAMSKVAEKWDNELSRAFARTVQEMQLGKTRREAMRDMANGLGVADMTSFVAAIIQADQLGVSMVKVMRIQSETMRMKRKQRAEEKARQAPVKIMIPLVFFIFPTILIILLGPAYFQVRDSGVSNSYVFLCLGAQFLKKRRTVDRRREY